MTRHYWPQEIRIRVHAKTGGCCWLCGHIVSLGRVTMDHVVPRSKGGRDDESNLMPAHRKCNEDRGNKPAETTDDRIALQARAARIWNAYEEGIHVVEMIRVSENVYGIKLTTPAPVLEDHDISGLLVGRYLEHDLGVAVSTVVGLLHERGARRGHVRVQWAS